jgi:hypothetical protein
LARAAGIVSGVHEQHLTGTSLHDANLDGRLGVEWMA